jgi:hypothetical protein
MPAQLENGLIYSVSVDVLEKIPSIQGVELTMGE